MYKYTYIIQYILSPNNILCTAQHMLSQPYIYHRPVIYSQHTTNSMHMHHYNTIQYTLPSSHLFLASPGVQSSSDSLLLSDQPAYILV